MTIIINGQHKVEWNNKAKPTLAAVRKSAQHHFSALRFQLPRDVRVIESVTIAQ